MSVLEGIEGGFAIFSGILAGLSFETSNRRLLLITAAIGIIVNGFNSSAIRYSSQHFTDELDGHEKRRMIHYYLVPAAVEFLVYLGVCFVILLPLMLIGSLSRAVIASSLLTVLVLFAAGYYKGSLLKARPWRDGLELAVLGGLIITVGALAGYWLTRL